MKNELIPIQILQVLNCLIEKPKETKRIGFYKDNE